MGDLRERRLNMKTYTGSEGSAQDNSWREKFMRSVFLIRMDSIKAKLVLVTLATLQTYVERNSDGVTISINELCELCSASRNSVFRSLAILRNAGVVMRRQNFAADGSNTHTTYKVVTNVNSGVAK